MLFLPSLLEYSLENLETKSQLILNKSEKFRKLQKNSSQKFYLHLDFVLPNFAKDRNVMTSLSLTTIFRCLEKYFNELNLDLNIHLMGDSEDLLKAYNFFDNHKFKDDWNYSLLITQKFYEVFTELTLFKNTSNLVGVWLGLENWQDSADKNTWLVKDWPLLTPLLTQNSSPQILLMTVTAGKSGQNLTPQIQQQSLKVVNSNPQINFILDGGWAVEFESDLNNLSVVSYSSFWKKFNNL